MKISFIHVCIRFLALGKGKTTRKDTIFLLQFCMPFLGVIKIMNYDNSKGFLEFAKNTHLQDPFDINIGLLSNLGIFKTPKYVKGAT